MGHPDSFELDDMRHHLKTVSCALGLALAILAHGATARAEAQPYPSCERDPTESDISAAKGAYEAGQVSFQEADYERALLYWEDAFRRDCTAVKLLLNIARAYELSGDLEAAINALQTYLDRRPDAKDRSSVEKWISNLQQRVEKQQEPIEEDGDEAEADSEEDEAAAPAPVDDAPPPAEVKRPSWPVWLTAGGIVVALTGHGILARGEQLRQDKAEEVGCDLAANECPSDAARDEANAAGEDQRATGAGVALVGHLAGITGGIIWWALWVNPPKAKTAQHTPKTLLQPVLSPGYQGLSVSGKF